MLGVIHRAVLGEGPPQLRSFFVLDNSDRRRNASYSRHSLQLACDFGSRPLDTFKRSVLGLCRVYNLLPAAIVACENVRAFHGARAAAALVLTSHGCEAILAGSAVAKVAHTATPAVGYLIHAF